MSKSRLLMIGLCLSQPLMACEISLTGTWQSDASATNSFNRANALLEERQDRFLASLMGKMTLEFTDKLLHLRMPDTQMDVKGELKPFEGFEEQSPYKILFCNERKIVIESTEAITGRSDATTYFFVGPNTMWTYVGGNNPEVPSLHIREYFSRIEQGAHQLNVPSKAEALRKVPPAMKMAGPP